MGFCGAFFGDLNDWIHQDHHFSFEPSGISKRNVLFQVVNIFQVAENVYLPMPDDQNEFFMKTFKEVNSASEFLDFLKGSNLERIKEIDVENVFSKLKEKKEIPFFFTEPIQPGWQKEKTDLKLLHKIFEHGPVGVTIFFLTPVRDHSKKKLKHEVVANGTQAKTVLLFVHPKKQQPESVETESLTQSAEPLDLSKKIGPSNSASTDSSALKLFWKSEYGKENNEVINEWVVKTDPSFEMCLRGAKCILSHLSDAENNQPGLLDWSVMLASLLKKCDEEIERTKIIEEKNKKEDEKIDDFLSTIYEEKTLGEHWRGTRKFFNRNSEIIKRNYLTPEGPIFLCSSDKSCWQAPYPNLRSIFSNRETFQLLLRPPRDEAKYPIGCPHCEKGFTFSNAAYKLPLHKLKDHPKLAVRKLKCLVCDSIFKCTESARKHLSRKHESSTRTGQKRKTEESSSPGCSESKRTE